MRMHLSDHPGSNWSGGQFPSIPGTAVEASDGYQAARTCKQQENVCLTLQIRRIDRSLVVRCRGRVRRQQPSLPDSAPITAPRRIFVIGDRRVVKRDDVKADDITCRKQRSVEQVYQAGGRHLIMPRHLQYCRHDTHCWRHSPDRDPDLPPSLHCSRDRRPMVIYACRRGLRDRPARGTVIACEPGRAIAVAGCGTKPARVGPPGAE